jgi:CRP-like cAMP-binding protein
MVDLDDVLRNLPIFSGLTHDERAFVVSVAVEKRFEAGEVVFSAGDEGGESYVVVDGAVELQMTVEDLETTLLTVRSGGIFGVLSWLDGGTRPVTARAVEPTEALAFDPSSMDGLRDASPAAAARVLRALATRLAEGVRTMAERYRSLLRWNLDVSGASGLGFDRAITDRIDVAVELTNGSRAEGTLLKVDQSVAGHELYLQTAEGVTILPYHGIARVTFPGGDVLALDVSGEEG